MPWWLAVHTLAWQGAASLGFRLHRGVSMRNRHIPQACLSHRTCGFPWRLWHSLAVSPSTSHITHLTSVSSFIKMKNQFCVSQVLRRICDLAGPLSHGSVFCLFWSCLILSKSMKFRTFSYSSQFLPTGLAQWFPQSNNNNHLLCRRLHVKP